ncbi:terminase large subunit [Salmonella enterica]|uniref:Terminase large subunit n=1 Tax=Salmonella enterica TaxID=28901 RepID=A0A762BW48_SALER|nr:terminase large subunit [Salmonella enterica]EHB7345972.1 terminase large subunit [Salmonella enterica subsp. enterica serovar Bracknell]EIS0682975.1 terminase large subunit [Salmonella enterica]EJG7296731.1 terminase large subunit [Salmonella enterica]EJH2090146.1 terminase large subunit [Salmonella enterica]
MATYPNVNDLSRYARDVVNGKILACRYVKLSCQRHLDDLEKAKDPQWPYRFDKAKAERFLRFSQKMPHTSGEWARRKLRINFEPWQKFSLGVPYGWVCKSSGLRRFTEIYIEVPRKNGKSAIAAAVGNYMFCADGEHGAEVYCGATTEKQAWKVFQPALQMVKKLPALRQRFSIKPWAKRMTRPDGSVFAPVIGDPGDGDSPSCAIIDEYHEHETDALYTTMTTGMGAREQPMTLIITTAGYDISSPCYDKREQVVEILEGIRQGGANEQIFGIIFTLDQGEDWRTEEALIKANPNYGVSLKPGFLAAKQEIAKSTPSQTNKILTKHFNLWVSSKESYYNLEKWNAAADKSLTLEMFKGESCYLGIDLANKLDLNAVVPIFKREINGVIHFYAVGARFYVPEDTIYSADPDKQRIAERYQSFVNQGVLTPTEGAEVDYRLILSDIQVLRGIVKIEQAPIDPYGATGLSHLLADDGITVITITQNYTNMSDPMREIEAALAGGRFHHDGNAILTWNFQNVVGKYLPGSDDIVRPTKQGDENKIDGAVSAMMGVGRAIINEVPDFLSSLSDEDLIIYDS